MKKQRPDIWLQENEDSGKFDDCACRLEAEYSEPGDNGTPAFFQCPLHAAASNLLEALKTWREFWDKMPKGQMGKLAFDVDLFNRGFLEMDDAIAKAEGRKEKTK